MSQQQTNRQLPVDLVEPLQELKSDLSRLIVKRE